MSLPLIILGIKKAVGNSKEEFYIKDKNDSYLCEIQEKKGLFGVSKKPIWVTDLDRAMFFYDKSEAYEFINENKLRNATVY